MPQIAAKDKIICSLFYVFLAAGQGFLAFLAPLGYLAFLHFTKRHTSSFTRYHCYQVIVLHMALVLIPQIAMGLLDFITNLLSLIPLLEATTKILGSVVVIALQAFYYFGIVMSVYGCIWTFLGRYTRIPFISEAIEQILRQY